MAKLHAAVRSLVPFTFEKSNLYLEDQSVLKSMGDIAKNHQKQSKHEDARHVWESVLYLCLLGHDENMDDPYILRAMDGLAESYEELHLYDLAVSLREELLEVLENRTHQNVDQVCEEMEQIASLYVKKDGLEDAEKWTNRVLEARMQAYVD